MKIRRLGAGAAVMAAAAAFAIGTGPAAAAAPQPTAAFAGHVIAWHGATTVNIRYTCTTTEGPLSHLFVAVKQGPQVDTGAHSSSQYADTFYSTNWKSDAGPNALNCNGVSHWQRIVLKPQPGFVPAVPRLHKGLALVQICVYDNVTTFGPEGPVDGGFAASYTMQKVHLGEGRR